MRINICFATDENYLKYMGTTIVSILTSAKFEDKLYFYILCNNVSDKSKEYISNLKRFKNFEIKFIDVDINEFEKFPAGGAHITNTTYYRYKIAQLCPEIDKIIYLDCDTVVKSSLSDLFSEDLAGYYLAGVEDVGYSYWRNIEPKYTIKGFYINAGVLLINLNEWRKNNLADKLINYTLEHKEEIAIGDQDVINIVCKGKIKSLDYKYNAQDTYYRQYPEVMANRNKTNILKAAKNPVIIHYTASVKPWNNFSMNRCVDWCKPYLIMTSGEEDNGLQMRAKLCLWEELHDRINECIFAHSKIRLKDKILSLKAEYDHWVIRLLGFKIKFKKLKHRKGIKC